MMGVIGYVVYQWIEAPNVNHDGPRVIYISTGSTYEDVVSILKDSNILINDASFHRVASWMKYPESVIKAGKSTIKPSLSNRDLIGLLRSGNQTPIKLLVNNVRTVENLVARIGEQIETDSSTLLHYFLDPVTIEKYGLNSDNFLTLFIPNTYEVYWNVTPADLLARLKSEHDKFWSQKGRREKAIELGLSESQVYSLASIVEKETQARAERPTVAGLYLNRLKIGMPLQADPTIVFATKLFDLRRVLNVHLEVDSPYNTYKNAGIPPGPIYMPSLSSIDAVLNSEEHTYLYMCARPDDSGLHAFASNQRGHSINASRYHAWLNARGIK